MQRGELQFLFLSRCGFACFAALLLTAFVSWDESFFPFVVPRHFYAKTLVLLSCFSMFAAMLWRAQWRLPRAMAWCLLFAFALCASLSGILGDSPWHSLVSSIERMQGVHTSWILFAFFSLSLVYLSSTTQRRLLIQLLAAIFALNCLLTLGYWLYQVVVLNQLAEVSLYFGNRAFHASFTSWQLAFFVAVAFLHVEARTRRLACAFAALSLLALLINYNRGSLLGLLVGLFCGGALALRHVGLANALKVVRGMAYSLLLSCVLGLSGLAVLLVLKPDVSDSLQRVMEFSDLSLNPRILMWQAALDGLQERPWLGVGPDNFRLVFDRYYPPPYQRYEEWVDNAHSLYFELLSTVGVLGLLVYALFLSCLIKALSQIDCPQRRILYTAILAGELVKQGFILIPLESQLLFYGFAALVVVDAGGCRWRMLSNPLQNKLRVAVAGMLVLACVLVPIAAADQLRALVQFKAWVEDSSSPPVLPESYQRSIYQSGLGEYLLFAAARQDFGASRREAMREVLLGIADNPAIETSRYSRAHVFRGNLFLTLGELERAAEHYRRAVILAPDKPRNRLYLGRLLLQAGATDAGLEQLEIAFRLDRSWYQARDLLARIYSRLGLEARAATVIGKHWRDYL